MHASIKGALAIEQVRLNGAQTRVASIERLVTDFPDLEYREPRFCSPSIGPRCDDFGFTSSFDLCVFLGATPGGPSEPIHAIFDGSSSLFLGGNCAHCQRQDPRASSRLRGYLTTTELKGLLHKVELQPALIERICRFAVQHTCAHGFDDQRYRTEQVAWLQERTKLHAQLGKLQARLAKSRKP